MHALLSSEDDQERPGPVFVALTGIAGLVVLLQGLWAGIFLEHDGHRDASSSWIDVHARGADLAIVLAAAATGYALLRLRRRRDLWLGSGLLTVLLVVESYLGGLIRDQDKATLTAVHVPLGMALLIVATWLVMRARTPGVERR